MKKNRDNNTISKSNVYGNKTSNFDIYNNSQLPGYIPSYMNKNQNKMTNLNNYHYNNTNSLLNVKLNNLEKDESKKNIDLLKEDDFKSKYPYLHNNSERCSDRRTNNFTLNTRLQQTQIQKQPMGIGRWDEDIHNTNNSFLDKSSVKNTTSSFNKNKAVMINSRPNFSSLNSYKTPILLTANKITPQLITSTINGLVNLGNSCYANTCLQNLIHCQPFIESLFTAKETTKKITKAFIDVCISLATSNRPCNPNDFLLLFTRAHSSFNGYAQHDTQEFCRTLLDDFSKEMNRVKTIPKYKEFITEGKTIEELNRDFTQLCREREDSIITDIFNGQLVTTSSCCNCNFNSFSFEQIIDLPLQFPESVKPGRSVSLAEMIDNYFKEETIKWDGKCEQCKQKTNHLKSSKYSSLPKVLIISFQRYNYLTNRKNNMSIKYDEIVNLRAHVDPNLFPVGEVTEYKLFGVSNHAGTMDFGHYFAYIKVKDKWYQFNDEQVREMHMGFEGTNVYCLFYEKKININ